MILAGKVRADGETVYKAGRTFDETCPLEVHTDPYVGRGGFKLARALDEFGVDPDGMVAVDIGASTGGFTDCLLQRGAKRVYAVDVGYGQIDGALRNDERVIVIDRQNARHITPDHIGEPADLVVIDVSFISLKIILPPAMALLKPDGKIIALVKPQFEVGKGEVENRGVIKDPQKHLKVLLSLCDFIDDHEWILKDLTPSPIEGQKGNKEFLILCLPSLRDRTSLNDNDICGKMVDGAR